MRRGYEVPGGTQQTFRAFDNLERVQAAMDPQSGDLLVALRKASARHPSPTSQSVEQVLTDLAELPVEALDTMTPAQRQGFAKLIKRMDPAGDRPIDYDLSEPTQGQVDARLKSAEGAMEELQFARQVVNDTGAMPSDFQRSLPALDAQGKELGKRSRREMDATVEDGSQISLDRDLSAGGDWHFDNKAIAPNAIVGRPRFGNFA